MKFTGIDIGYVLIISYYTEIVSEVEKGRPGP